MIFEVQSSDGTTEQVEFEQPKIILGRHRSCDLIINEQNISRKHATIEQTESAIQVEDLGSINGTFVNGRRVSVPVALNQGDRITIGTKTILLLSGENAGTQLTGTSDTGDSFISDATLEIHGDAASDFQSKSESNLQAIFSITKTLELATDAREIFRKTLTTLMNVFPGAERAFFMLAEDDRLKVVGKRTRSISEIEISATQLSRSVPQTVYREQKAILSTDAQNDSRFQNQQSIIINNVASVMCAPLVSSDSRSLGVIYLDQFHDESAFGVEQLELLTTISLMVARTLENIRLHHDRLETALLEKDIAIAEQVQQLLIPKAAKQIAGFDTFHLYEPFMKLGGDYIDYIQWNDDRWLILLGDVTGKGMGAALIGARLHAAIRMVAKYETSLVEVADKVNRVLCDPVEEKRFVTANFLVVSTKNHEVEIVHAGHIPPFLKSPKGSRICIEKSAFGMALGMFPEARYSSSTLTLDENEYLFMTTDGVTEALSEDRKMFEEEGVLDLLDLAADNSEQIVKSVEKGVLEFAGKNGLDDDLCMLAIGRS